MAKNIINKKTFSFIDLFAGIGGFRLALDDFGGTCVFSSEWDGNSQDVYLRNFGELPHGDITKIKGKDIPEHDVLCAGFPCQAFSISGKWLGFDNFTEAFNVIGLALGVQPASVKNYRDEFDPFFPNERQGWHKREIRKYCKDIYDTFHALNLVNFSSLLKNIIYKDHDLDVLMEEIAKSEGEKISSFAKRLITGQAAEQYFKDNFLSLDL